MRRKFITNLAFLLFLNLLVKPFWILGVDRNVQNMVGAAEYGLYFSLFNFSVLFNILLDLGITNFNNKHLAQEQQQLPEHFNALVPLKFILGIAYGCLLAILAVAVGYGEKQMAILIGLAINQFLLSFILFLRSNFSALLRFRLDSVFSVLDRVLMILFCTVVFCLPSLRTSFQILWFVGLQTLAYLLTALLAFVLVGRYAKGFRPKLHFPFFVSTLKQSYPYALLALLMSLYCRVDGVMLERMLPDGAYQSGIYAQAYRLFDVGNNVAFLFGGLLLPMFARMLKQGESVARLVWLSSSVLLYPALLVAVASCLFSLPVMSLLYHSHVEQSAVLFKILMLSFIGMCFTYIYGALLTANGNLKCLNLIAASCLVLNVGLNFLLIPRYGARGAALANCATQFLSATLQFGFAKRYFKFSIAIRNLLIMILSVIVSSVLSLYLETRGVYFIFNSICFFGLNVTALFVFKILNIKYLIAQINKKV